MHHKFVTKSNIKMSDGHSANIWGNPVVQGNYSVAGEVTLDRAIILL